MPKSKKKQKAYRRPKHPYHLNWNIGLVDTRQNIQNGPMPPNLFPQEDFTKDLLDIGDSSNNFVDTTSVIQESASSTETKTVPTTPSFVGKKIPVKMREDIVRNKGPVQTSTGVNKKVHTQSSQLLKDCLTSDIKTAVQDNIKVNEINEPRPEVINQFETVNYLPRNQTVMPVLAAPSGVPRSFLTRVNQTVIEPQLPIPEPIPHTKFIRTIQRSDSQPVPHVAAEQSTFTPMLNNSQVEANTHMYGTTSARYSPTDLYSDLGEEHVDGGQEGCDHSLPPELWQPGEKRVSAFDRLGPLAQSKTPKLTINLSFNKEQAVREVVDDSPSVSTPAKVYVPVHEREDILHSTDDTVMKYVGLWPWAKGICIRRTAKSKGYQQTVTNGESSQVGYSPTAMMMLKEQMDEIYQRDNTFLAVSITGYPPNWTKEDVLDAMLDNLKDKSFVPCFIEFNEHECKFLVIRNRSALLAIHALDFHIQKDGVQLSISISQIILTVLQLDFIPRLILRKRLAVIHCEGNKLNLSAFTLQPDVSHFIYYPLNYLTNQNELMKLQTDIIWSNLTELDLSHNRLTTVEGFDLENRMHRLLHLDLSHNYIEKATMLLCCRKLTLHSLKLEGNPLCHDYIDPQHYITVVKMMFPTLKKLDDVPIHLPGDLPVARRNYCPHGAGEIIDNFLQLFVPLLDSRMDDRVMLANMYAQDAIVTITYRPMFDGDSQFRFPRNLLLLSRVLLNGTREFADGKPDIEKLLRRWPDFEHDLSSFSVDVMIHTETSTVFRLDGIVKLPSDSLAENDQLIAFSRTIHLYSSNGIEYKIANEMIYWDVPTKESSDAAFGRILVKRKQLSFKIELPPDEECKKKLVHTFRKLTELEEPYSVRCLEMKNWDIREALDYFILLYKADNLEPLMT